MNVRLSWWISGMCNCLRLSLASAASFNNSSSWHLQGSPHRLPETNGVNFSSTRTRWRIYIAIEREEDSLVAICAMAYSWCSYRRDEKFPPKGNLIENISEEIYHGNSKIIIEFFFLWAAFMTVYYFIYLFIFRSKPCK